MTSLINQFEEPFLRDEHPELHHYTDWEGLQGIINSGSLWATIYTALNDFSEVSVLSDFLIKECTERIANISLNEEILTTRSKNYFSVLAGWM